MRLPTAICLLTVLFAGCDDAASSKTSSTAPNAKASASSALGCGDQANQLGQWLKSANDEGMGPPPPFKQMGMKLVERADGDPWAWFGAALMVTKDAVQLDFDKLGDPGEATARDKIAQQLKSRAQLALSAGISMGLDVYIHPDTPWEVVVATVERVIASGFRTVGVVFAAPTKLKAPDTTLLAQLQEADKKRRSEETVLDEGTTAGPADRALATCRPAVSILRQIGKGEMTPRDKTVFFAKRAHGAWQSCRCRVDAEVLKAVQWHWLGRSYGPPTRSLKVLLAAPDDKDAKKVSASKSKPWAGVAEKLVKSSKGDQRISLVAE